MEGILYAEVYCICIIITSILLFWTRRNGMRSFVELCLMRLFACFLVNFSSNFLFTLFNKIFVIGDTAVISYTLKTLYHITLIIGVFLWCIYADVQTEAVAEGERRHLFLLVLPSSIPIALTLLNLRWHMLFEISGTGDYLRGPWFQFEMLYLLGFSAYYAIRLLRHAAFESDLTTRTHLFIASTFPLCILASWLLSFAGEAFPVICVTVMIELVFLFLGTTMQQISIDRLTQVNNRQNLLGFMNHKLKNRDKDLYLLMVDVDYFKQINDTYGHLEGDNALVKVAKSIKVSCGGFLPRPYIARYGGDEFIIIVEADRKRDIDLLCRKIRETLANLNESDPYQLQLSIGCALLQDGQGPKELIHEADKMLYDVKRNRNR